MPVIQRELFGGAISCELPSEFQDVSEIRQVYVISTAELAKEVLLHRRQ